MLKIVNGSGLGHQTQVFHDDGTDITKMLKIDKVTFIAEVDNVNHAVLTLSPIDHGFDVRAEGRMERADGVKVKAIHFQDGSKWELPL